MELLNFLSIGDIVIQYDPVNAAFAVRFLFQ
jgi:hypothetical protein